MRLIDYLVLIDFESICQWVRWTVSMLCPGLVPSSCHLRILE